MQELFLAIQTVKQLSKQRVILEAASVALQGLLALDVEKLHRVVAAVLV